MRHDKFYSILVLYRTLLYFDFIFAPIFPTQLSAKTFFWFFQIFGFSTVFFFSFLFFSFWMRNLMLHIEVGGVWAPNRDEMLDQDWTKGVCWNHQSSAAQLNPDVLLQMCAKLLTQMSLDLWKQWLCEQGWVGESVGVVTGGSILRPAARWRIVQASAWWNSKKTSPTGPNQVA